MKVEEEILPRPVIALICEKFGVNEDWLRYGEGEMFKPAPSDVLDQLASEYNLVERFLYSDRKVRKSETEKKK